MSSPAVQKAIDAMTKAKSVEDAVLGFFTTGLPAAIEKAKADAVASGASADELAPFDTLSDSLSADAQPILDAILANTPVTPALAKQRK